MGLFARSGASTTLSGIVGDFTVPPVWGHFDLSLVTGAPPAAADPDGYVFVAEDRQHIVYRGTDGHIHELAYTRPAGPWGHFDLSLVTGAPPAAGDPDGYVFVAEDRQHIVYRGTDGHIHELAYTR
jgi:hypothetical protein